MRTTRFRVGAAVSAFVVAVAVVGLIGAATRSHSVRGRYHVIFDKRSGDADALGKSAQDLAGNRGEPNAEGDSIAADPDQAAFEAFQARAYPAGSIPAGATQRAQQTFATYGENKQFTKSANSQNPFSWDLIGPTHATQPGILSFSGAQFHMAGRVTAMINTPTCTVNSNCRLWVAAAGGGIWRTDNPFSPDPYWVFTSKSFRSNAI